MNKIAEKGKEVAKSPWTLLITAIIAIATAVGSYYDSKTEQSKLESKSGQSEKEIIATVEENQKVIQGIFDLVHHMEEDNKRITRDNRGVKRQIQGTEQDVEYLFNENALLRRRVFALRQLCDPELRSSRGEYEWPEPEMASAKPNLKIEDDFPEEDDEDVAEEDKADEPEEDVVAQIKKRLTKGKGKSLQFRKPAAAFMRQEVEQTAVAGE
jgi:hypothetical protein